MEKSASWSVLRHKYHTTRKCLGSKAASLILLWSFAVGVMTWVLNLQFYLDTYGISSSDRKEMFGHQQRDDIAVVYLYGSGAVIFGFFPLAGFLADVKCGRYRTVTISSDILLAGTEQLC